MLDIELMDLVNRITKMKAETQNIEVKAAHDGCPKRLYDTLSSFANQDGGGVIVFGIDERLGFTLTGVYDIHDLQKKVTEQCNQMVPPVRAVFTVAELDGKSVCSAEIPSADLTERPCYYSGIGRIKGSYIRVGDADLPMTEYEIYSYEAFRNHTHDDERVIERADISQLDQDRLNVYVMKMRAERTGFSKLSSEQSYEMLGITRKGVPTLAAVLNFSPFPQGYLPQLAIIAIVVPGKEMGDVNQNSVRFLDNKRIEGPLSEMLEGALSFCKRNMKTKTIIDPETGVRTDKPEYPLGAIREIVLNALIHRDYSILTEGTPIQIDFFEDRLEVHNPGGLYGRMTVEDLGNSRPELRNPTLATMSEFLLNTENRYSGIPTIRREMAEAGLPEPVFENRRNEFVVTLYNRVITEEKNKIHGENVQNKNLLEFCRIPRTRHEIADYLEISTIPYAMKKYIQPLLEEGKLALLIPDKPKSRHQKYITIQK